MEFSNGTLGTLLIVAIILSIGALVAGVLAVQGERRVRATYARFARGRREDVVTLLEMHMDEVKRLQTEVRRQQATSRQLRALLARNLSRIGTVRYDAFDDMGGRLSFSIALLDEHGDGTVITAMNGRVQTRTYAKPVKGGTSPHNLSEEELQAISDAMDSGAHRMKQALASLPGQQPTEDGQPGDGRAPGPVVGEPQRQQAPATVGDGTGAARGSSGAER